MSSLNRKIKPAVPIPCQKRQHGWRQLFLCKAFLNRSTKRGTIFRGKERVPEKEKNPLQAKGELLGKVKNPLQANGEEAAIYHNV